VKIGHFYEQYGNEANLGITVYNENGDAIETALDEALAKKLNTPEVFGVMRELYELARRKALNVDSALDDLLSSL